VKYFFTFLHISSYKTFSSQTEHIHQQCYVCMTNVLPRHL